MRSLLLRLRFCLCIVCCDRGIFRFQHNTTTFVEAIYIVFSLSDVIFLPLFIISTFLKVGVLFIVGDINIWLNTLSSISPNEWIQRLCNSNIQNCMITVLLCMVQHCSYKTSYIHYTTSCNTHFITCWIFRRWFIL